MPTRPGSGRRTESADRPELGLLPKAIIAIAVLLVMAGVLWHGVTLTNLQRIWRNLADRPGAVLSFRFILQPCVAAVVAVNHGVKDARKGHSPFFRAILREPEERVARLYEGLNATARILVLGIAVDIVYQLVEFERFYPVESVLIALLLAFIPYCLIRGVAARMWRVVIFSHQPH
jgi:hypothetical protein